MITNGTDTVQTVKSLRIKSLALRNFKGVRSFEMHVDGEDTTIRGRNGTGKTTLADAMSWLLYDKDSAGRADFDIKTLTSRGEAIHNLEHEVEAQIINGGSTVTLKKIYFEKWTRKRGQASPEFSGHKTDHFVDDVPCAKEQYQEFVANLAPESLVRMLTDPFYFAGKLHWQDRRTTLTDVCGDVTDEEVIDSDTSLKDLPGILNGRSMEDVKEIIKAKRRKINDELQAIPVRIDETRRNMPDASGIDARATDKALAVLREKRSKAEQDLARIEAGGELAEQKAKLSDVKTRIQEIVRQANAEADKDRSKLRDERNALRQQLDNATRALGEFQTTRKRATADIERIDARLAEARDEWHKIDDQVFQHDSTDTCAACGQALPADQVEAAHQKALEEFNARKARALSEIDEFGKSRTKERQKLVEEVAAAERGVAKVAPEIESVSVRLEELDEQIRLPGEMPDMSGNAAWDALRKEGDTIRVKIADLEAGSAEGLDTINATIDRITDEIMELEGRLGSIESASKAEERITELEKEERRLAGEYEELERHLYLCDQFTRRKVSMLDERINSRFETVRFRLFEEQINGGLKDVCSASVGGVPWPSVNHAGQINAGLEIIDVLGEHYGVRVPVWVDQAESVTDIRPTEAQQIVLVVDRAYPELTIVNHEVRETVNA
jgi:DNA repair exonuclease SbcCD ATPase subunit